MTQRINTKHDVLHDASKLGMTQAESYVLDKAEAELFGKVIRVRTRHTRRGLLVRTFVIAV